MHDNIPFPLPLLNDALPAHLDTLSRELKFMTSITIHINILTSLLLYALPSHLGTLYPWWSHS